MQYENLRYSRQTAIPQVGATGQEKLGNAMVTVVGAGGLGSPVLTYLACAGVGTVRIIDSDTVSESNLNRQFLHSLADIGKTKALSAKEKLTGLNPEIEIISREIKLMGENVDECLQNSDVVIDCVDNIKTRLIVNEYCLKSEIPLVEAGVHGFYGYVMAVHKDYACPTSC